MREAAVADVPATAPHEVPAYDVDLLAPRTHRYCVAVFCINENGRIAAQLAAMAPLASGVDIIVADGGSTDGSLAPHVLARGKVRALLTKRGPGKLSAQMRMAFDFALGEGYDGVIVVDGNNKDDTSAIPHFVALLDQGFDHVQGSRYVPGGLGINTPFSRTWGVRLLHAPLISVGARYRYTDTTNGFRAYSRRLLEDARVAPFRSVFSGYELHYYLAIRAARVGFRVTETPVTRTYPNGAVPTKIHGMRGNAHILMTLLRAVVGRFDPEVV